MLWGARLLARAAAVILLLELSPECAASTKQREAARNMGKNAAVVAVGRHKRDGDTLREVFIEHINNVDDPQPALSLFIGFLILGAIMIVVLIFLGCLLLIRLSESRCAKYQRLYSQESLVSRRRSKADNTAPSQVFTYVDLSNIDVGGINHRDDCDHGQAPRFSAIFTTVTNVSDRESRRKPKRGRSSGGHTSRLLAMGIPSLVPAVDRPSLRRVRSQDENIIPSDTDCVSAAERMAEPPNKRVCVHPVTGMSTQLSGSVNAAQGFETYTEHHTEVESAVPQMEVKVRDRVVKTMPHGTGAGQVWSPTDSGLAHRADETTTGGATATSNRYYPEGTITHGSESNLGMFRKNGSWSENMSPLFSPGETSAGPSLLPKQPNSSTSSDSTSEDSSRLLLEKRELSGHGRFYEPHVPGEAGQTAATWDTKSDLGSGTNSLTMPHSTTAVVPYEDTLRGPVKPLQPKFDAKLETRNDAQAPFTYREKLVESVANDTKEALMPSQKALQKSTPAVTPVTIKANVTLQRVPSQVPSAVGSPSRSEPRELTLQLPEMIAYFDKPEMTKSFKATIDESSASPMTTKVPSPYVHSSTPTGIDGSLSPSTSDNRQLSRKLRLPQPPTERRGEPHSVRSPSELSAVVARSPRSPLRERDGRSSTLSHSLEDVSHPRAPLSHTFSESGIRCGDVDKRKVVATLSALAPRSEASLVASDSQPSGETTLVASNKNIEPKSTYGLPESKKPLSDRIAKASEKNDQLLSILEAGTSCEQNGNTGSVLADLTVRGVGEQAPIYPNSDQSHEGPVDYLGPVKNNVRANGSPSHANGSPPHEDPIALKAEITVDGAWPIVRSDDKHVQPLDHNQAVKEGSTSAEAAKRDHYSPTGKAQSTVVECVPDETIMDTENAELSERDVSEAENRLTPRARNAEKSAESRGQELVAPQAHRAAIEPRPEAMRFPVLDNRHGLPSSTELVEQPTSPAVYSTVHMSAESPKNVSVDGRQVVTLPVRRPELVSLSPSSSVTDSTIVQLKPSEIQPSRTSGALATSDETGLDVTLSGVRAGSDEIVSSEAHKAALVSPNSSQSSGAVDLKDQFRATGLQTKESPRVLADGEAKEARTTIDDGTPGQGIANRRQSTQDTTVATRADHPGPSRMEGMNSLPLSEHADSTDVFFGAASPVASQGSKDLISFNTEQTSVQQKETTPDVPFGTERNSKGASPQSSSSNEKSSKS